MMKIDIQIHDATPEEVQRLLIGMQVNTLLSSKPAPVKKLPATTPRTEIGKFKTRLLIPFHYKKQRREYDAAWHICKKHGKPYPEAILLERGKQPAPAPAAEPEKKKPAKVRKEQACTKLERIAEINKKPDGRKSNRPSTTGTGWTDEEKAAIDGCKDKAAAIAAYRAKFPDSKRNDNSIYMKWHDMDIRARKKKRRDAPENNEVKPSSQAIDSSNEDKEPAPEDDVKIIGSEGLSDIMPESNPTNSDRRNSHLRTGDKVKHINPRGLFAGIGTVKRTNLKSGELLVAFDNGMEWLPEKELAPVTP